MKLSIIVVDKTVYVDEVMRKIDTIGCKIPSGIHALQWEDDAGWIEYNIKKDGSKPTNKSITTLPVWANACYAKWEELSPQTTDQAV